MISVAGEQIITFDPEGYVIKRKCALYEQYHNILLESAFFKNMKFLAIENSDKEIAVVREYENSVDPIVMQDFTSIIELELQLKNLSNEQLTGIFKVSDPLLVASIADTI